MGSMLRCEIMTLCDIYLQPEAAFEIISILGELDCVQILDKSNEQWINFLRPCGCSEMVKPHILIEMNSETQASRSFTPEVLRCAEIERKLRYVESEMTKDDIYVVDLVKEPKTLQPNEMVMFENTLEKWQSDIMEMSANQTNLMKNYLEMTEMYYVLTQIGPILGNAEIRRESLFTKKSKGGGDIQLDGQLGVITGVVRRAKSFSFEMMMWRVSRGNIYFRVAAQDKILLDPYTGKEIRKVAFLAICQGEQLLSRMEKVCSGFHANRYPCPKSFEERRSMIDKLELRLTDLEQVLKKTQYHRCKALRTIGRQWYSWMTQVIKAKAVYHQMNRFSLDITKKCLIGQCWIPKNDLPTVQNTLETCSQEIGTNVPSFLLKTETNTTPPTYHRTNKFTKGFQVLINAYGVAAYREINPGLYTIISFPFLFAVMFGDFGHALIMLSFALWMLKNEKKFMAQRSKNEIWNIFFGGRYVILLMSLFSMFTGLMYNDFFSKSLNLSASFWKNSYSLEEIGATTVLTLDPKTSTTGRPYVYGLDPVWKLATKNNILFENSMKMKMSIILGMIHMIFGLCLSVFNHIYFKKKYAIILRFIPELTFMCCILSWLVFMIYYKWWNYSATSEDVKRNEACAPLILILFIDMVLMSTSKPVGEECDAYMMPSQKSIQMTLLVLALVSVPVLLLATPIYEYRKQMKDRENDPRKSRRSTFRRYRDSEEKTEETEVSVRQYKHFSEMMIAQSVHTIEFVLSTISHTASYLRLWALSLAHTQLSEMLWSMVLSKLALSDHTFYGVVKLFVVFAIWASFTLSILVVMEGLSAFLHTLRLHWVEFMSKFFIGEGVVFRPFSFKDVLEADIKKDSKD